MKNVLKAHGLASSAFRIWPIIFVGGCAALSAATLPEVRGHGAHIMKLSETDCVSSSGGASALVIPPAIVDILYSKGSGAFKSYVERKAGRFTAQYTAVATVDSLTPGTCLQLQRIDRSDGSRLMSLLLEIRSRGRNAVEIVPTEIMVQKFAASTSPVNDSLQARITLSVGLSFVNAPPLGPNPVTELTLPVGSVIYEIGNSPKSIFSGQSSKLFPNLGDIPVNVAVTISEAGNGSDIFNDAVGGFDANANALKAVLGEFLNSKS